MICPLSLLYWLVHLVCQLPSLAGSDGHAAAGKNRRSQLFKMANISDSHILNVSIVAHSFLEESKNIRKNSLARRIILQQANKELAGANQSISVQGWAVVRLILEILVADLQLSIVLGAQHLFEVVDESSVDAVSAHLMDEKCCK